LRRTDSSAVTLANATYLQNTLKLTMKDYLIKRNPPMRIGAAIERSAAFTLLHARPSLT
jgi:hypothetical protein